MNQNVPELQRTEKVLDVNKKSQVPYSPNLDCVYFKAEICIVIVWKI